MSGWKYVAVRVAICGVVLLSITSLSYGQNCANPPTPTITSSVVPTDVCVPTGFGGNPIQFFDDYSWRTFIALVWPAATGQRGQPDSSKTVAGPGPRVFETFKFLWEIFHNDGSTPAAWNLYDAAQFNACNAPMEFGEVALSSFSKFSDLGQAGFGNLVGPLVAQNQTYVRYLTGFNKIEFDQIVFRDPNDPHPLYLRANIPKAPGSLIFNDGSLDVKSSWILMTGIAHLERYYTRTAQVLDPKSGKCYAATVGLVGLHIVQKTPTRPQWIWSTFEQVDNVPPAVPGAPGTFNFNDGGVKAMPGSNPFPLDPLTLPTPRPFNVQRLNAAPIHPSTATTNASYQKMLQGAGSVWQFYQLVMTQFPLVPSEPNTPGTPLNTFPGANATSAFANVTMETFDQANIRTGCMACHNATRLPTDFVWALNDHAFPPNVPNFLMRNMAVREMQNLMRSTAPR